MTMTSPNTTNGDVRRAPRPTPSQLAMQAAHLERLARIRPAPPLAPRSRTFSPSSVRIRLYVDPGFIPTFLPVRAPVVEVQSVDMALILKAKVGKTWRGPVSFDPKAKDILTDVAAATGFSIPEIKSIRRDRRLVKARQWAAWRMAKETSMSLPAIGRVLGDRDHTTILHSIRKHEAWMKAEQE